MANHYLFECLNPCSNTLKITLSFEAITSDTLLLKLPTWRPGRYETANFSQNMYRVKVSQKDNEFIKIQKISKCEWEVTEHVPETVINVSYEYYAHTMDAGNSWVDENMWYINFVNCCLSVVNQENNPHTVTLDVPSEYKIACGLSHHNNTLEADSFEQLADSPVIASPTLQEHIFTQDNCDFHIWIQGNITPEWNRLETDFRAYTKEQVKLFGSFPCTDYHYLFHILPYKHYHGVEHPNSTVITLGPDTEFDKFYDDLLGISSHELFHTWNIKRLRPKELSPYPFFSEPAFDTGYIAEGITTYYGDLMLKRSGVFNDVQYLKEINNLFKKHFGNHGRHQLSLTESSFDLWTDGYKLSAPGRKVSIYTKGAIIALILDLKLRLKGYALDNVVKDFWDSFGANKQGYSTQDYLSCIVPYLGEAETQQYFVDYIKGVTPVEGELEKLLPQFGLSFSPHYSEDSLVSDYGFKSNKAGKVLQIDPTSSTYSKLSIGDVITNKESLTLAKSSITLSVNRFGEELSITLSKEDNQYYGGYKSESIEKNKLQKQWLEG